MRAIQISGKSQIPSVEQTRGRISDANPLVLMGGNPDLRQAYTATFSYLDNLFMSKDSGFSIGMSLNAFCTLNPIVSRSFYFTEDTALDIYDGYLAHAGSILNTFTNANDPAYSVDGGLSFSRRDQKLNLSSSLSLSGAFESRPQYLGNGIAHVSTSRVNVKLTEMYRPSRNFRLNFTANSTYTNASSDASGPIAQILATNAFLTLKYDFSHGYFINSDTNVIWHQDLSGSGRNNLNIPAGVEIGKRFEKNGLVINVGAYDLLNRGSAYSTSTTADSYIQKWAPSYGRYYLVNVVYEFYKRR